MESFLVYYDVKTFKKYTLHIMQKKLNLQMNFQKYQFEMKEDPLTIGKYPISNII